MNVSQRVPRIASQGGCSLRELRPYLNKVLIAEDDRILHNRNPAIALE